MEASDWSVPQVAPVPAVDVQHVAAMDLHHFQGDLYSVGSGSCRVLVE